MDSRYGIVLNQRRGFLPLFVGDIISNTGSAIFGSAINYLVFIRTNSALDVAYVGIVEFVPTLLFGLFAGAYVDRSNQRRLMIACDTVRSGVVAALPIYMILLAGFDLPVILGVVAIVSVFSTLFRPAARSIVTQIVERDLIQHANGLMTAAESLANSVSLAIGGILIELIGASLTLFYNTAAYIVSATMVALIIIPASRSTPRSSPVLAKPAGSNEVSIAAGVSHPPSSSLFSDVREGMEYLAKNRVILEMILQSSAFNFFFSLLANFWVVYEVTFLLTTSGFIYGVLLSSFAFGQAIGALVTARLSALRFAGKGIVLTNALCGLSMLTLVFSRDVVVDSSLLFVIGYALGMGNTIYFSVLQVAVPSQLIGRVVSADEVVTFVTIPLAQIGGAFVIGSLGIISDAVIAGAGLILVALITFMLKDFRRFSVVVT